MEEESKPKIQMFRDSEAISKITKDPVLIDVPIYGLNEDGDDLEQQGTAKAWLHRLNWLERNQVRAASSQAYKFFMENDGEKETVGAAIATIISRMTVYYSLRRDSKPNSERFFPSKDSIMEYPVDKGLMEIHARYNEEFNLTEKEWGNWLRARSCETSSALPVKPEEPRLEEKSLN